MNIWCFKNNPNINIFSYLLPLIHQKENLAEIITIYIITFEFLEIQFDPSVGHKRLLIITTCSTDIETKNMWMVISNQSSNTGSGGYLVLCLLSCKIPYFRFKNIINIIKLHKYKEQPMSVVKKIFPQLVIFSSFDQSHWTGARA